LLPKFDAWGVAMEAKDKISIILEEYKSLRAEILQRTTMLNQTYAVAGTVAAGILGAMVQYRAISAGVAMIAALIALVVFATWLIDDAIRIVAFRLRQIESEINALAEHRLLVWETEYGMEGNNKSQRIFDAVGFIKRLARRFR
jgi:hypothetical protein